MLLAALLLVGACASRTAAVSPVSPLEARYRLELVGAAPAASVSTSIYRQFLGHSLFSACRMVPSDSHMFDARARRCGALQAAVRGIARLFLERAATPDYLRPVRLDGRLRWLDLPDPVRCR
jgi:hypothetical protein